MNEKQKIYLFISHSSLFANQAIAVFKKAYDKLPNKSEFEYEIIDVLKKTQMADDYKIEVLPTLIYKEQRLCGLFKEAALLDVFKKAA